MFEVIEIKNYDTYHKYGTDWNTDYICKTDEIIDDISTLIEKVKNTGYELCGDCSMVKKDGNVILKTAMYYLYEQIGKISIRTLQRWNKNYLEANKDWKALVNNYSYGCESQLITDLSDIEKYYLLKYMLHQNKFNLGKAYELICIELKAKGFNKICSLSSYRRVWQYVIANHAEMVAFSRGGIKSALDTQLPHITKDLTKLNVGDVIVGDGHTLDFMVLNPLTNKPCRATP